MYLIYVGAGVLNACDVHFSDDHGGCNCGGDLRRPKPYAAGSCRAAIHSNGISSRARNGI